MKRTPDIPAEADESDEAVPKLIPPRLIAGIVALILVGFTVFMFANNSSNQKSEPSAKQTASAPSYQTLLPSGSTIKDLGGWKKLTPPNGDPFYSYNDKIGKVVITVSQQQLPVAFQSDTAKKVADMAKAYNATTKLSADGITAYIGTSSKGPQSVIFTKNNLLIMIQSKSRIKNAAWKKYLSSLTIPNSSGVTTY